MSNVFSGATLFNSVLTNWDTANVTYMNAMFKNAISINLFIIGIHLM